MDDSFERLASSDGDADWRDAYRSVLDACVPDCVAVEGSAATVPRANALAALADAEGRSTDSAETLLADLDAEGVVDCAGDSVAVLFDPDADRPEANRSLTAKRWRVAVDALVAELERLDAEIPADGDSDSEDSVEENLEATAEAIRDLTPGDGVPDPEDLDDGQYERFLELREEFTYYKELRDASAPSVGALAPGLADRADGLRELPDSSADPLAAFGAVVEATAALESATENGDPATVRDRFARLAEVLDDLAE